MHRHILVLGAFFIAGVGSFAAAGIAASEGSDPEAPVTAGPSRTPPPAEATIPSLDTVPTTTAAALESETVQVGDLTRGTMPIPIDGQSFDEAADGAPDYIAVLNRDGSAIGGYVAKHVFLDPFPPATAPAYGPDLQTLVGSWVQGKGFVALEEDPDDVAYRTLPPAEGGVLLDAG